LTRNFTIIALIGDECLWTVHQLNTLVLQQRVARLPYNSLSPKRRVMDFWTTEVRRWDYIFSLHSPFLPYSFNFYNVSLLFPLYYLFLFLFPFLSLFIVFPLLFMPLIILFPSFPIDRLVSMLIRVDGHDSPLRVPFIHFFFKKV